MSEILIIGLISGVIGLIGAPIIAIGAWWLSDQLDRGGVFTISLPPKVDEDGE